MVGIKVGRAYVGLGVDTIVAVAVWLGIRVGVAVTVALGDGIGDGMTATDCSHAINCSPIARNILAPKRFFM